MNTQMPGFGVGGGQPYQPQQSGQGGVNPDMLKSVAPGQHHKAQIGQTPPTSRSPSPQGADAAGAPAAAVPKASSAAKAMEIVKSIIDISRLQESSDMERATLIGRAKNVAHLEAQLIGKEGKPEFAGEVFAIKGLINKAMLELEGNHMWAKENRRVVGEFSQMMTAISATLSHWPHAETLAHYVHTRGQALEEFRNKLESSRHLLTKNEQASYSQYLMKSTETVTTNFRFGAAERTKAAQDLSRRLESAPQRKGDELGEKLLSASPGTYLVRAGMTDSSMKSILFVSGDPNNRIHGVEISPSKDNPGKFDVLWKNGADQTNWKRTEIDKYEDIAGAFDGELFMNFQRLGEAQSPLVGPAPRPPSPPQQPLAAPTPQPATLADDGATVIRRPQSPPHPTAAPAPQPARMTEREQQLKMLEDAHQEIPRDRLTEAYDSLEKQPPGSFFVRTSTTDANYFVVHYIDDKNKMQTITVNPQPTDKDKNNKDVRNYDTTSIGNISHMTDLFKLLPGKLKTPFKPNLPEKQPQAAAPKAPASPTQSAASKPPSPPPLPTSRSPSPPNMPPPPPPPPPPLPQVAPKQVVEKDAQLELQQKKMILDAQQDILKDKIMLAHGILRQQPPGTFCIRKSTAKGDESNLLLEYIDANKNLNVIRIENQKGSDDKIVKIQASGVVIGKISKLTDLFDILPGQLTKPFKPV